MRMTRRTEWIAVAGILTALTGFLGMAAALTSGRGLVGPGKSAPDFRVEDVRTGDEVTLADYQGQVVLLNIWATWCKPCELEMPSMQRLHEELGPEGLRIVAVSIDVDPAGKVLEWVDARALTFDILHDRRGKIQQIYQTTGVPESFVIDRHGVIVKRQIGAYEWDQPPTVALFRRLLQ
jgi:cytochrome c biogenesis protein CcmG/thiol:disulfide interchange protein DsbE